MKKRFLSILLVLCMVMSFVPAAFAATALPEITVDSLEYRITDETNNYVEVSGFTGTPTAITIPDKVTNDSVEYTVVGIGGGAFNANAAVDALTSVTMPSNSEKFTYINGGAFANCHGITTLSIPASVTTIGNNSLGAFYDMTGLTSVTFGESSKLRTIAPGTFSGCTALTSLNLPDGVTEIGGSFVNGCTALTSLSIPASVTDLDINAFAGYYSSADGTPNVTITAGGKYALTDGVLYDDTALLKVYEFTANVTVPEGIKEIGNGAFATGNTTDDTMKSIVFPSTMNSIGENAFAGQTGLTDITIPASVADVGLGCFDGCTGLQTVTFDSGSKVTAIPDTMFNNCSSLTTVTFPKTLTAIGEEAFNNCAALTSIEIPSGVTQISDYAFFGCLALESIVLPDGLKTIGEGAFELVDEYNYENNDPSDHFFFFGAPAIIVILAEDKTNGLLAAQNMEFVAEANGLGVLFSGYFTSAANVSRKIKNALQVPKGKRVAMTLVLGYPDVKFLRSVPRKELDVRYM